MEGERTVMVWGHPQKITVHQRSKSVWVAVGEYMGHHIETKGRSAGSAVGFWADAAKYKGN
jgi:hypothetical protein